MLNHLGVAKSQERVVECVPPTHTVRTGKFYLMLHVLSRVGRIRSHKTRICGVSMSTTVWSIRGRMYCSVTFSKFHHPRHYIELLGSHLYSWLMLLVIEGNAEWIISVGPDSQLLVWDPNASLVVKSLKDFHMRIIRVLKINTWPILQRQDTGCICSHFSHLGYLNIRDRNYNLVEFPNNSCLVYYLFDIFRSLDAVKGKEYGNGKYLVFLEH